MEFLTTIDDYLSLTHDPVIILALFIGIFMGIGVVCFILDYYVKDAAKRKKKDI